MTFKKFRKLCDRMAVTIDDDGRTIEVRAPKGSVFALTDLHIGNVTYYGKRYSKPEAYSELAETIKGGLANCTETECEWCNSL